MPPPSILFRITRPVAGAGYDVELFVDGASRATASIADDELLDAESSPPITIQQAMQATMLSRPKDAAVLVKIGGVLYSLLVRGNIAAAMPAGNPASVDIDAPPDLAGLPWETLHDGRNFLAGTGRAMPTARRVPGHGAGSHGADHLPLRVLVVVGDRDGGTSRWEDELRAMRKLFRKRAHQIDWEVLLRPSRAKLQDSCHEFRPHVFHFIGHGDMTPGQQSEPVLNIWNDETKRDDTVTVKDLEALLVSPKGSLRMAVFNACASAQAAAQKAAYDFGRSFISNLDGCCAIAMQGNIEVNAAAQFSAEIYDKLAKGVQIDVAVGEARRSLQSGFPGAPDWAFPVFYVGCSPDLAVPMKFKIKPLEVVKIAARFDPLRQFVDRQVERRYFWSEVAYRLTPDRNLLIIYGEPESGKTWLAEWIMRNWALSGERVRYIRLNQGSYGFVRILEQIRDGMNVDWGENGPYPAAPFQAFQTAVNDLLKDQPRTAMYVPDLFDKFITALNDVVKKPLLLVLDSFEVAKAGELDGIVESDFGYFVEYFVTRAAAGEVTNVRLMLVTGKNAMTTDPLSSLGPFAASRAVERLPYDQFVALAQEGLASTLQPDFLPAFNALVEREAQKIDQQSGWTMSPFKNLWDYTKSWPREPDL